MSRWLTKTYPFLLSLVPALFYAASYPGQYGFGDLAISLAMGLIWAGLIYGLAALPARGRAPSSLPAFVSLLGVVWFFGYAILVSRLPGRPPHLVAVPVGLALSAALIWWIARRRALLTGMGRFLTLTGTILVGWYVIEIATAGIRAHNVVSSSALVRELAQPIDGPDSAGTPRRNIYLIVVDEYANSAVLRERFGFDNRPFEDSLRAMGFYLPRLVRSNYGHTLLSLPSLLNSAHLTSLGREMAPESKHPAVPNYLLEHSRVATYLERRGYHYVFFPSLWWHSTSHSAVADSQFQAWRGFNVSRAMSRGELQRTVRGATLLRYLDRDHHWEAEHVQRSLQGFAELPDTKGPVFAFAHILKPHDPYVFDHNCATLPRQREDDDTGPYIEQLRCVNRLLLQTVHRILRESEVPPIILIQGDHGTNTLGATGYPNADQVPPDAARERFGAFGAYYLPEGGAAAFGDTVTVVNVLGNVLRYYFGAHLPRGADEQYISPATFPYAFRRVDARWLAGDQAAGPNVRAGR